MDKFDGMWTYVLRCEGPSYYVGKSEQLRTRIKRHFAGTGSQWTRKHPPRTIVRILPGDVEQQTYHEMKELAGPIVFGAGNTKGRLPEE